MTKDYFHEFEVLDPLDKNSKLKQLHHVIFKAKALVLGTFHGLENLELQPYLDEYNYRFSRRNMRQQVFLSIANEEADETYELLKKYSINHIHNKRKAPCVNTATKDMHPCNFFP